MKDLIKTDKQIDSLSKNELKAKGAIYAEGVIEGGFDSPLKLYIRSKKIIEFLNSVLETTKTEAAIEYSNHGEKTVKLWNADVTEVEGAYMLDYDQDTVYAELSRKLKERKALLDLRFRSENEMYDEDGVAVPKVKIKGKKRSSLHIKF